MISMFAVFFVELFAFRWGTAKIEAAHGKPYGKQFSLSVELRVDLHKRDADPHGHELKEAGHHSAHGPEASPSRARVPELNEKQAGDDQDAVLESHGKVHELYGSTLAQIIGVTILEFGVIFHSLLIGLTLAVDQDFKVLFVVLVFHRKSDQPDLRPIDPLTCYHPSETFEGLGLGSRLAYLDLPAAYSWARYAGAILYGLTTPLGIAIGLGVRYVSCTVDSPPFAVADPSFRQHDLQSGKHHRVRRQRCLGCCQCRNPLVYRSRGAPRTRVCFQPRGPQGADRQAALRTCLHDRRCGPYVAAWTMGVNPLLTC